MRILLQLVFIFKGADILKMSHAVEAKILNPERRIGDRYFFLNQ